MPLTLANAVEAPRGLFVSQNANVMRTPIPAPAR